MLSPGNYIGFSSASLINQDGIATAIPNLKFVFLYRRVLGWIFVVFMKPIAVEFFGKRLFNTKYANSANDF
jgi:hypothetical protein